MYAQRAAPMNTVFVHVHNKLRCSRASYAIGSIGRPWSVSRLNSRLFFSMYLHSQNFLNYGIIYIFFWHIYNEYMLFI